MRILVHVTGSTMLRHFIDVMLTLAGRGHEVRIASSDTREDLPPPAALRDRERITFISAPGRRDDAWSEAIYELRTVRDFLRYLEPPFGVATKLRARARRKAIKALTSDAHTHLVAHCPQCQTRIANDDVVAMLLAKFPGAPAHMAERLALIESAVPSDKTIETFLKAERPDALLVTPLIKIGSYQADYVKSAKALGLPVGFPVFSWDNLSTKGMIHVMPDRVFVWNERQATEAVELHRFPREQVVVTGAPRFDRFFAMRPAVTREQFCDTHNLDPALPIVTYLCSSEFVAGHERDFVLRWVDEVRGDELLAHCNIVIRPHPRQKGQWKQFQSPQPRVAVTFPESITTDQSLYDTIHHSAAVVGLNTSAQLEAGIVGKPVLTILAPEFSEGQQGTLHFQYLLKDHGGFVEVAPDFPAHRRQLASAVAGEYDAQSIRRFIEYFLRPHGRERAVTPIMADAIEDLAHEGRRRRSWWLRRRKPAAAVAPGIR